MQAATEGRSERPDRHRTRKMKTARHTRFHYCDRYPVCSCGHDWICPGVGAIGLFSQAALKEDRNCGARTCGSKTTTIAKLGYRFRCLDADSPNSRSRVSRHLKPAVAAASSKSPLTRVPQPRAFAVSAVIPSSASKGFNCRGIFTSSSHMWGIQQFGSGPQNFRDGFMRKWTVVILNFLGTHSFREAGKNQRC